MFLPLGPGVLPMRRTGGSARLNPSKNEPRRRNLVDCGAVLYRGGCTAMPGLRNLAKVFGYNVGQHGVGEPASDSDSVRLATAYCQFTRALSRNANQFKSLKRGRTWRGDLPRQSRTGCRVGPSRGVPLRTVPPTAVYPRQRCRSRQRLFVHVGTNWRETPLENHEVQYRL